MTIGTYNLLLDFSVFLFAGIALWLCRGKGAWVMTLLGLFLSYSWLLADDLDFADLIPGSFRSFSLTRTGVSKAMIATGILLDFIRICYGRRRSTENGPYKTLRHATTEAEAAITAARLEAVALQEKAQAAAFKLLEVAQVKAVTLVDTARMEAERLRREKEKNK